MSIKGVWVAGLSLWREYWWRFGHHSEAGSNIIAPLKLAKRGKWEGQGSGCRGGRVRGDGKQGEVWSKIGKVEKGRNIREVK